MIQKVKFTWVPYMVASALCATYAFAEPKVDLYGRLDAGLNYTRSKSTAADGTVTSSNAFSLASGQYSQSRWGIKGYEDLGDGYTIGFVLESGFDLDTGKLKSKGYRLFHRDSLLFVTTPYGEIGAGRSGTVNSKSGRYGLMKDDLFPMDNGWGDVADTEIVFKGQHSRVDNLLTLRTKRYAGFQFTFQHSFKQDDAIPGNDNGTEGTSEANRFWGIGMKYKSGNLVFMLAGSIDTNGFANPKRERNGKTITGAISYDLKVIRPMFGIQYFDTGVRGNAKGSGIVTGFTAPLFGGKYYLQGGWMMDSKVIGDEGTKYGNWMIGTGYRYDLSKNIWLYCAAGYSIEKKHNKSTGYLTKEELTVAMAGMVYRW